jgi:hypothetical protein
MMNSSAMSILFALLIFSAGLVYPATMPSTPLLLYWTMKIMAATLMAYCFYLLAVDRAGAWGSMVKGAYDLYRSELLRKLGYQYEFKTREAECKVWREISRQIIYGEPYKGQVLDYSEMEPFARTESVGVPLEVARGVKLSDDSESVTICLSVKNASLSLAAQRVVLTDKLADGLDYEWDSARVGDGSGTPVLNIVGANPYQFSIGNLAPKQSLVLTYRAIPRNVGRKT